MRNLPFFSATLLCLTAFVAGSLAYRDANTESTKLFPPSEWTYKLHEKRSQHLTNWRPIRRHEPGAIIPLRFGLKQSNLEKIDDYLYDISHPDSPSYGMHWTAQKIREAFAPGRDAIMGVRHWLSQSGVSSENIRLSAAKNWIEVNVTIEQAEALLKTEYQIYRHQQSGAEHLGCSEYHLPVHVSEHIDIVLPTVHFDVIVSKRDTARSPSKDVTSPRTHLTLKHNEKSVDVSAANTPSSDPLASCGTWITPACLVALYGINYTPKSPHKNSFGVVEYTPQAYIQSDLDLFAKNVSGITKLVGKSPNMVAIDGATIQTEEVGSSYNAESNLDLQYAMSLVGPSQNVTLYQVGDMVQSATFNNFIDALDGSYCTFEGGDTYLDAMYPDPYDDGGYTGQPDCGTTTPAHVISTSYGYVEAAFPTSYTTRQCAEYAKLGLMGVTVLYSSGDNGVANDNDFCWNPEGFSESYPYANVFNPSFPSTCPYVTAVGATQIIPGGTVRDREIAVNETVSSGGGFSNTFAMPSYQKNAVTKYLSKNNPGYPADVWNSTGQSRAFPDLSANGANYILASNGVLLGGFGTSASTPVVAAMVALINDARITIGKRPVGFINPAIYSDSFAEAFNDIVTGSNPGCGTAGFNASVGWDPVTGLGTPKFQVLMEKFLLLP